MPTQTNPEPSRLEQDDCLRASLTYAEEIIATLCEPFVVLDGALRVKSATASFYKVFLVAKGEVERRPFFDLDGGQWDLRGLRAILGTVTREAAVPDFEVESDLPAIGRRSMLLIARRFPPEAKDSALILLAIEDVTDRRQAEQAEKASELRYRRLFETAKDGIFIIDPYTFIITHYNI